MNKHKMTLVTMEGENVLHAPSDPRDEMRGSGGGAVDSLDRKPCVCLRCEGENNPKNSETKG